MRIFEFWDEFFEGVSDFIDRTFGPPETEELRQKRRELEAKKQEYYEAKRRAREEYERLKSLSLSGSAESFRKAVEEFQKDHPDYKIEAKNVEYPNGYYREVRIFPRVGRGKGLKIAKLLKL